jgi:anti-sigma factor RsiW
MNDQFLHDLRREPAPAFARRLRASLDEPVEPGAAHSRSRRVRRWLPLAASVVLVSIAFTLPAMRAGAQAFLDLFRITNVVGVSFEAQSLQSLATSGLDLPSMLGAPVETSASSGGPVTVTTTAEASEIAGIDVLEPAWRPVGLELSEVRVMPEEAARFTANTGNIELILDALGIDDLSVPAGIDGQSITLRIPPIVQLRYGDPGWPQLEFLQARSPEITMPPGFDLPVLAEIALRIVGVDRERAYTLAWTVDWRSTLIVPIPAGEAEFEEININGHDGLAVQPRNGHESVLLWSDGERVFAMAGSLEPADLQDMARTVQ